MNDLDKIEEVCTWIFLRDKRGPNILRELTTEAQNTKLQLDSLSPRSIISILQIEKYAQNQLPFREWGYDLCESEAPLRNNFWN